MKGWRFGEVEALGVIGKEREVRSGSSKKGKMLLREQFCNLGRKYEGLLTITEEMAPNTCRITQVNVSCVPLLLSDIWEEWGETHSGLRSPMKHPSN